MLSVSGFLPLGFQPTPGNWLIFLGVSMAKIKLTNSALDAVQAQAG